MLVVCASGLAKPLPGPAPVSLTGATVSRTWPTLAVAGLPPLAANEDWLVAIAYPNYKVHHWGVGIPYLGHAGLLLINGTNGKTRYFEYGRYDRAEQLGIVVTRAIPDAELGTDGKPTIKSLEKICKSLSTVSGQEPLRISAAVGVRSGVFPLALKYAEGREKENGNAKRVPYQVLKNNCMHFVKLAFDAAGLTTPCTINPRPNSYIDKMRESFLNLDYDPTTGHVVISP